jgi:hypothetical protein
MDWEGLFKKYIWNEQTTPYFTKVSDLNQRQGKSEIILYSLLLGVFFAIICLFSIGAKTELYGHGVSLYGFSIVCAAVIFGIMNNYYAALYLSASPLASLAYLFFHGLSSNREDIDTLIVTILLLLLLRYSIRIVTIAKSFPDFPEPKEPFYREKGGGL